MAEAKGVTGHAFISYVREDSSHADQLQGVLESAGIPVWRDTDDLWPGQDWQDNIKRAINDDALVFIACFSRVSLAREFTYQNDELALAIGQLPRHSPDEAWLIPVRFDECDIPDHDIGAGKTLASIHGVDFFGDRKPEESARLVASILRILDPANAPPGRRRLVLANTLAILGWSSALAGSAAVWLLVGSETARILATAGIVAVIAAIVRLRRSIKSRAISWTRTLTMAEIALMCICGTLVVASTYELVPTTPSTHSSLPAMGTQDAIAFNNAGTYLASADRDGNTYLWRLESGKPTYYGFLYDNNPPSTLGVNSVAFSPRGFILAAGDANGDVYLWVWRGYDVPHNLLRNQNCAGLRGLAYNHTGKLLAVACGSGQISLWRLPSHRLRKPLLHDDSNPGITSVAFNPRGDLVAAGSQNGNVYLWNITTRRLVATSPAAQNSGPLNAIAFSRDGRTLAAAAQNGDVYLWHVATADNRIAPLPALPASASSRLTSVAFNPSGSLVAAGDANSTVDIWTLPAGTLTTRSDPGGGGVNAIAFSPNGTLLAAGDNLGRILTWPAGT